MQKKNYHTHILLCVILFIFNYQLIFSAPPTLLSKTISISVQNQQISIVLKQIEQITGVKFMYNSSIIENKKPISITIKNTSIRKALQLIINDQEIVFYELDNYIIISYRKDVPQETIFQIAFADNFSPVPEYKKAINDTLIVYDTITISDTLIYIKYDTIAIYDTITIKKTEVSEQKDKSKNNQTTALSVELTPFIQTTVNNPKDDSQFSYQAHILLERQKKNISFGVGLGYFAQKGGSLIEESSTTVDSTLHTGKKTEVHKFQTGSYFYIDEHGDTIRVELWDSVTITVPYSWYSHETKTVYTEKTIKYSVSWISIPFRFSYKTNTRKKIDAGIAVSVIPSIAVSHGGQIYSESKNSIIKIEDNVIAAFNIFVGISPSLYYNINKKSQLYFSPTLQTSVLSNYTDNKYYTMGVGLTFGVTIKLSK